MKDVAILGESFGIFKGIKIQFDESSGFEHLESVCKKGHKFGSGLLESWLKKEWTPKMKSACPRCNIGAPFQIDEKYLVESDCLDGYNIKRDEIRQLGVGATSVVYSVQRISDPSKQWYAMKMIIKDSSIDFQPFYDFQLYFDNEVKLSKMMGEAGIGPKVFETFVCDQVFFEDKTGTTQIGDKMFKKSAAGFIIMKKLFFTVKQEYDNTPAKNRDDFFDSIKNKLIDMRMHNVNHEDIHDGNVMFDENHTPFVIDWGYAKEMPHTEYDIYAATKSDINFIKGFIIEDDSEPPGSPTSFNVVDDDVDDDIVEEFNDEILDNPVERHVLVIWEDANPRKFDYIPWKWDIYRFTDRDQRILFKMNDLKKLKTRVATNRLLFIQKKGRSKINRLATAIAIKVFGMPSDVVLNGTIVVCGVETTNGRLVFTPEQIEKLKYFLGTEVLTRTPGDVMIKEFITASDDSQMISRRFY